MDQGGPETSLTRRQMDISRASHPNLLETHFEDDPGRRTPLRTQASGHQPSRGSSRITCNTSRCVPHVTRDSNGGLADLVETADGLRRAPSLERLDRRGLGAEGAQSGVGIATIVVRPPPAWGTFALTVQVKIAAMANQDGDHLPILGCGSSLLLSQYIWDSGRSGVTGRSARR